MDSLIWPEMSMNGVKIGMDTTTMNSPYKSLSIQKAPPKASTAYSAAAAGRVSKTTSAAPTATATIPAALIGLTDSVALPMSVNLAFQLQTWFHFWLFINIFKKAPSPTIERAWVNKMLKKLFFIKVNFLLELRSYAKNYFWRSPFLNSKYSCH